MAAVDLYKQVENQQRVKRFGHGDNTGAVSGHTFVELLLVISISGVLTGTGVYLLHALLWRQQVNAARHAQSVQLIEMIGQLQQAVDTCCANPFSRDPWMELVTGDGEGWYPLRSLELLVVKNGQAARWQWEAPQQFRVFVDKPSWSWMSGDRWVRLRVKFPDSINLLLREGIAIEGFRETVLLE